MRILEVSRYKNNFADHQLPFVTEQGESLRHAGCEVDYFLVRGNYIRASFELRTKIREFQPDIVHAHYGLSGITAAIACTFFAPKGAAWRNGDKGWNGALITTFHNGEWHNRWVNLLSSLFALRAKHLIYVAPHIREKMYFKHPHYTILPCGVNIEESKPTDYQQARTQLGLDSDTYYILFGGAFSNTRKNVALLRIALSQMGKKMDENSWVMGSNSWFNKIQIIEMRGMDRKSVALYMSACDLFALPTKNEGSPQALKEAMACNCPILATDCADIAYLLGRNDNQNMLEGHFLLSNKGRSNAEWIGDDKSIEELRGKIEEALQLPRGFRTSGRNRIVKLGYTHDQIARQLMTIYQHLHCCR